MCWRPEPARPESPRLQAGRGSFITIEGKALAPREHTATGLQLKFLGGMGAAGGWDPKIIVSTLLLNGAWGVGVALLMRLLNRVSVP